MPTSTSVSATIEYSTVVIYLIYLTSKKKKWMNGIYKGVTNRKASIENKRGTRPPRRQNVRSEEALALEQTGGEGVSGFLSVIKHQDEEQLGEEGFISLYSFRATFTTEGN